MKIKNPSMYSIMLRGYIRDGKNTHTDEALLLACLLRSHGTSRKSQDMRDVRVILNDHNLEG